MKFNCRKNPSYECFLQKCREKFWNPEERKRHCLEKHDVRKSSFKNKKHI